MRWLRSMFYRMVTLSNNFHIPPDVGDFQVIDKKVLQALRQFGDQYPYLRGMIFYCGFPSVGVPYTWKRRERGILQKPPIEPDRSGPQWLVDLLQFPASAGDDRRRGHGLSERPLRTHHPRQISHLQRAPCGAGDHHNHTSAIDVFRDPVVYPRADRRICRVDQYAHQTPSARRRTRTHKFRRWIDIASG